MKMIETDKEIEPPFLYYALYDQYKECEREMHNKK